jgi:hypothetical protein
VLRANRRHGGVARTNLFVQLCAYWRSGKTGVASDSPEREQARAQLRVAKRARERLRRRVRKSANGDSSALERQLTDAPAKAEALKNDHG